MFLIPNLLHRHELDKSTRSLVECRALLLGVAGLAEGDEEAAPAVILFFPENDGLERVDIRAAHLVHLLDLDREPVIGKYAVLVGGLGADGKNAVNGRVARRWTGRVNSSASARGDKTARRGVAAAVPDKNVTGGGVRPAVSRVRRLFSSLNAAYLGMNAAYLRMNAAYLGMNAAYLRTNAAYLGMNAVYIGMNAVYLGMNAVYLGMNAVYLGMNAAYLGMNAASIRINAAFIRMDGTYRRGLPVCARVYLACGPVLRVSVLLDLGRMRREDGFASVALFGTV